MVSGSASASGKALFKNFNTASSLPGFASTLANNANFSMMMIVSSNYNC
jgi:hypothetical protein